MDECAINNGGCEQMCHNIIGSFYCTCGSGYQLDENGLNCTGKLCMFYQVSDVEQNTFNFPSTLQILMSVTMRITTTAMRMHSALIQRGVLLVHVNLVILEME